VLPNNPTVFVMHMFEQGSGMNKLTKEPMVWEFLVTNRSNGNETGSMWNGNHRSRGPVTGISRRGASLPSMNAPGEHSENARE